jgi:two-component system chemotaxis response regulator CheB
VAGHDIVVVGASAGGVEALCEVARGLPPGLPASVFVVCHFPMAGWSQLPDILSRQGALLAGHARDGEPIYPGHVYVAPPNHHLVLGEGVVLLNRGPRENHFRPSIDPLFRSAARVYGPRVVGVLLSGALADGVAGLMAVRSAGGLAVLQSPQDALFPSLPQTAQAIAGSDHVAPARDLGPLLAALVHQPVSSGGVAKMDDPILKAAEVVARDMHDQSRNGRAGALTVFSCPECGGSLWQLDEKGLLRFRCHTGHVYAGDVLLEEKSEELEAALWTAVRTFIEKGILARQLAARQRQGGSGDAAARYDEEAALAESYAALIRDKLLTSPEAAPRAEALAEGGSPPEEAEAS